MKDFENKIPKRNPDAAFRIIDGEAIVVLPERGEVKVLNEVGSVIWELIDGSSSIDEISKKICKKYEVTEKTARSDVLSFLKQLTANGMIIQE